MSRRSRRQAVFSCPRPPRSPSPCRPVHEPVRRDPDARARDDVAGPAAMTPFAVLGLAEDAELLDIKRAYARLLKATRPDDDAVGFQRLEEAYVYCVAVARGRQQAAMRAELADSMPALGAPRIVGADSDELAAVVE